MILKDKPSGSVHIGHCFIHTLSNDYVEEVKQPLQAQQQQKIATREATIVITIITT